MPSPTPPVASVIVLAYNGREYVDPCLESLLDQAPDTPPFEVILFDNASSDGTADHVAASLPEVRVVRSPTNLGFAAGNVAALAHAQARWVTFLNQDTVVGRRFVAGLLDAVSSTGARAAQASMILPWQACAAAFDRRQPHPHVHVAELTRAAYVAYHITATGEPPARTVPGLFLSGAAFLVDRDVLERVGGLFDPDFWAYAEDTDLSLRLHAAGLRVVTAGDATILHDLTPSMGFSRRSLTKTFRILRNRQVACLRSMRAAEFLRALPDLVLRSGGKVAELPSSGAPSGLVRLGMVGLSALALAWTIASLPRHRRVRARVLDLRVGGGTATLEALRSADARWTRAAASSVTGENDG